MLMTSHCKIYMSLQCLLIWYQNRMIMSLMLYVRNIYFPCLNTQTAHFFEIWIPVSIISHFVIYYKMDSIQLSICKPRRITCNDLSAHSTLTKVLIVSVKRSIINGTPLPPFYLYCRMKHYVNIYWNQDGIVSTDDLQKH